MNMLVFFGLLIASTTIAYHWTPLAFKPVLAMAPRPNPVGNRPPTSSAYFAFVAVTW
jgi:hypothetical protein